MRFWPGLSLLLLSLTLTGCNQPEAVDLVETYASRTSNAIDVDFDLTLQPATDLYPRLSERRERLTETPEIRQGLLELLELRHCDLIQLISERNSNLGRVASESQKLIYELKLIPALDRCIASIAGDAEFEELLARLAEIKAIKSAGFPHQLFNSIYNVAEMEQQFSLGETPIEPGEQPADSGAITATDTLASLVQLLSQAHWEAPAFTEDLESTYEQLYRSRFGGQWLASFALLTQTLDQSASAIEQRLSGRPICFEQRPNNQANILWNVFIQFYVGSLQPYMAKVEREAQSWRRLHTEIIDKLSPSVPQTSLIAIYFDQQGPIWRPYLEARDRHTQAWQAILEQCGMRPGLPAS